MKSRRRIAFPESSGPRRLMVCCGQLQQGFATREMGFNSHFAKQKPAWSNVCMGSYADMAAAICDVCFTLNSGH
jgi:hypothetical protein